jgi:putative lipoic acid-binding regulatory protein
MNFDSDKFRNLLEEQHDWPCEYTFKFIVPADQVGLLLSFLDNGKNSQKPSKNGKYISVTSVVNLSGPDAVIDVYRQVSTIKGVLSL